MALVTRSYSWIVLFLGAIAGVAACHDGSGPAIVPSDTTAIVSNPVSLIAAVSTGANVASSASTEQVEQVAYVSLAPGMVPDGQFATIHRVGATSSLTASVIDGGVDPVPIAARAGDRIDITVTIAGSLTPALFSRVVPGRTRPTVVRADPPPRKRDVPLNTAIVVVFSEPVASSSLTDGVLLLRDTTRIPGTVRLLGGSATAAVFQPAVTLDPTTDYTLVVSSAVRDLTGDALGAPDTVQFTTGTTTIGFARYVAVVPNASDIVVGSQVQLYVTAVDSEGFPVIGRPVVWTSESPAVATVSVTGVVTGIKAGLANIRASVDVGTGVGIVTVATTRPPILGIFVTPSSSTIPVNGALRLTAVVRDTSGNYPTFRPVTWTSSDSAIASIELTTNLTAIVTGHSTGTALITATIEGKQASAQIGVVTPGPFVSLSTSDGHTCGITTDNWALCWGFNRYGGLGNGGVRDALVPVPVLGGVRFSQVSVGWAASCAGTPGGEGYCWGVNEWGQLAHGGLGPQSCPPPPAPPGYSCSTTPLAMVGGHVFTAIDFGWSSACGLTPGGAAYCWGQATESRLGNGSPTGPELCGEGKPCGTVPVAVAGGRIFSSITVGPAIACGLTTAGAAYCWGDNEVGELGDGTTITPTSPVAVAGGHTFRSLSAGWDFACGVTTDDDLYCWGRNDTGALGLGTFAGPEICPLPGGQGLPCSTVPVLVSAGLHWSLVSAGAHVCGVTTTGSAYCWGLSWYGGLGIGADTTLPVCGTTGWLPFCATTPVPVVGGLTFQSVAADGGHTCGITTGGIAYCWGENFAGQLGIGVADQDNHPVPERVANQP